jgi:hypothetical protein
VRKIFILFLLLISFKQNFSQSLRGGNIQISHLIGFSYSFSIEIYSNDSSLSSLIVSNGDGTIDTLENIGQPQYAPICFNQFSLGSHTYSGLGIYIVSVQANHLMDSVANIEYSASQPLYLEDTLKILDPAFFGYDNSPIFLNTLIDFASTQQTYIYNPNAFDTDGDSLSFSLFPYFANGYSFPSGTDSVSVNKITGELVWDKPIAEGNYAFAILVTEFRSGIIIGNEYVALMITVDNSLGMNSIQSQYSISIFPNPAQNQASITCNLSPQSQPMLSILNLDGMKISEMELNPYQHQFIIDVSKFPSGVYILELLSSDGVIGKKLVKE